MSAKAITLFAPQSNIEIVSIKLKDDSFSKFECQFSRVYSECTFFYIPSEVKASAQYASLLTLYKS